MPESITYDASYENSIEMLNKLVELHPKGVEFLCPVCGATLIVILTNEEAQKWEKHPGIYCPKDSKHVWRMFNLRAR